MKVCKMFAKNEKAPSRDLTKCLMLLVGREGFEPSTN